MKEQRSGASTPEIRMEYVPISQVIPYENNARRHGDEDVDVIVDRWEKFTGMKAIKKGCQ